MPVVDLPKTGGVVDLPNDSAPTVPTLADKMRQDVGQLGAEFGPGKNAFRQASDAVLGVDPKAKTQSERALSALPGAVALLSAPFTGGLSLLERMGIMAGLRGGGAAIRDVGNKITGSPMAPKSMGEFGGDVAGNAALGAFAEVPAAAVSGGIKLLTNAKAVLQPEFQSAVNTARRYGLQGIRKAAMSKAVDEAITGTLNDLAPTAAGRVATGDAVQDVIPVAQANFDRVTGGHFQDVARKIGDTPVETRGMADAAREIQIELQRTRPKASPNSGQLGSGVTDLLKDATLGKPLDWEQAMARKAILRGDAASPDPLVSATAKRVQPLLEEAMQATAARAGADEEYEFAKSFHKDGLTLFNGRALKAVADVQGPEPVVRSMVQSPARVRAVYEALDHAQNPILKDELRRVAIQEIVGGDEINPFKISTLMTKNKDVLAAVANTPQSQTTLANLSKIAEFADSTRRLGDASGITQMSVSDSTKLGLMAATAKIAGIPLVASRALYGKVFGAIAADPASTEGYISALRNLSEGKFDAYAIKLNQAVTNVVKSGALFRSPKDKADFVQAAEAASAHPEAPPQ